MHIIMCKTDENIKIIGWVPAALTIAEGKGNDFKINVKIFLQT